MFFITFAYNIINVQFKLEVSVPRLLGAEIPAQKRVIIALQSVYGIGPARAQILCDHFNIGSSTRTCDLDDSLFYQIGTYTKEQGWLTSSDLRRFTIEQVNSEVAIQTRRGRRHKSHLPVRSARTRRNGRTARRCTIV